MRKKINKTGILTLDYKGGVTFIPCFVKTFNGLTYTVKHSNKLQEVTADKISLSENQLREQILYADRVLRKFVFEAK
jgi:hypothetical protein